MKKIISLSLLLITITSIINISLFGADYNDKASENNIHNEQESAYNNSFFEGLDDGFLENMRKEINDMHHKMTELESSLSKNFQGNPHTVPTTQSSYPQPSHLGSLNLTQDDNSITVTIQASGIKTDKLKDIELENNTLFVQIPLAQGTIDLVINPQYAQIIQKAYTQREDKAPHKEQALSAYSSSKQVMSLPAIVDINTAQAELDNNRLTIKINKKNPTKININHKNSEQKQNNLSRTNSDLSDLK